MAQSAFGQGFILIPEPPPMPVGPPPIMLLREVRLGVKIEGQTAVTRVEHTFFNPSNVRLEGMFYHPLPRGAAITNFALWVGGVKTQGEVLPSDQARGIYEDIVRRQRDPGLLEFVDDGLFRARIFPIEPHSEQKVEIEYAQILRSDAGLTRYGYPFRIHEGAPRQGFHGASIKVQIHAPAPLRSVYSPSHNVEIEHKTDREAVIGYETSGRGLADDFVLYYSVSPEDLAASLVSNWGFGNDGTFLLLLSPPQQPNPSERLPKDIVFVLDTSGSMREDDRIGEAKKALKYGLRGLGEQDRFGLVSFSTGVYPLAESLMPATKENVAHASEAVDQLVARGGTYISEALFTALRMFDTAGEQRRPKMLVFLTDGHPTVGITNPLDLLQKMKEKNQSHVRVFCFGIGVDLSTKLLDSLAEDHGGSSDYVDPKSDLETTTSAFFDKVDFPVLSDVRLKFDGVEVLDVYPQNIGDLFFGQQLTILGRYRKPGKATLTLKGWKQDQEKVFTFPDLDFSPQARNDFVPRLWAARRIGHLLEEIRRNGENKELVDEIVDLGQRYGIPSPYASYLVVEDAELERRPGLIGQPMPPPMEEPPVWRGDANRNETGGADMSAAPAAQSEAQASREVLKGKVDDGETAVAVSKDIREKKSADKLEKEQLETATRQVAGRTFYLRAGVWYEARVLDAKQKPAKTVRIKTLEKSAFDLAQASPELRQILALGTNVQFVWNDVLVIVGEKGEAELSSETRQALSLP